MMRWLALRVGQALLPAVLVLCVFLPIAHAQLVLSVLSGTSETPVASRYDFPTVSPGDVATANFRLRNTANAPATITLLSVAGVGFSLSAPPALPLNLNPQGSTDFTVAFQAMSTGPAAIAPRSVPTVFRFCSPPPCRQG